MEDEPLGTQVSGTGPVAILAIHGVGKHLSGASADAISTLLMSIGRNGTDQEHQEQESSAEQKQSQEPPLGPAPSYSGFVTTAINVPLRPVQARAEGDGNPNDRHQYSPLSRILGMFDERRGFLAGKRKNPNYNPGYEQRELRPDEPDRGEYGYQFMLTQVAGYKGEVDRNFETARLEGKRNAASPAATVHIYDSHYSDLTKPENSILSFFLAFYQLLFHLASLSLLAVYWAETENVTVDKRRVWRWRIKSSVNAWSVRLLTMFVPSLNLILLGIACSAFADKLQNWPSLPWVPFIFAALLGSVATFFVGRIAPSPARPFLWSMIPLLGAALGALFLGGLAYLYNHAFHLTLQTAETLLLFCWLLTAGAIISWIAKIFDPVRPGVFWLTIALYLVNVSFFLFYLLPLAVTTSSAGNKVAAAALWAVQWIFAELSVSWILCLLFAFLSWPLGKLCISGIAKSDLPRKARAVAAFRTGRLAFAVPTILFVIVTCALWSGVVVSVSDKAFNGVPAGVEQPGLARWPIPLRIIPSIGSVQEWINGANAPDNTPSNNTSPSKPSSAPAATTIQPEYRWSDYLKGLLLVSVTPGLPVTMAIFVLSLLLFTWAVLPSVVYEIKPEWTQGAARLRIRWLGEWLSRGLDNTAIVTRLLWSAIVVIPLFFFVIDWLVLHTQLLANYKTGIYHASRFTLPLITWTGLILAVSGVAIFGFILKYLTTVLDTVLDVDNYLRTSPEDQTPRARVAERCVSLLRYIAAYRDEQNRPYSKLIIVAHSLGSIVTADLLRYLERSAKASPDPDLARYSFRQEPIPKDQTKLPIYVFSMGSPLRQLLNRFFPHLYWWVSDVPDNSLHDVGGPVSPPMPAIVIPSLPRTTEMNVRHWVNAYRSGDYVGRSLWIGQWLDRNSAGDPSKPPDIAWAKLPQGCSEMCIGLGAHTHYWDRTAPDIAAQLDQLIV